MTSQVSLDYLIVDVFTSTHFLGNPLAIVWVPKTRRQHLSQEAKHRIAREFSCFKTVFVHLSDEAETGPTSLDYEIFPPSKSSRSQAIPPSELRGPSF